jgi:UMP-CMP kinase
MWVWFRDHLAHSCEVDTFLPYSFILLCVCACLRLSTHYSSLYYTLLTIGKGTQSALMEENYPVVHLSVGQLLRDEQTTEGSPHRELIEKSLVAGQIVPVEISLQLVQEAMKEAAAMNGKQLTFLIDGFPRNYDNLTGWANNMPSTVAIGAVLVYKCPLKVLEERILERAKKSGRSDDNLASAQKRFTTFECETVPVITTLREAAALSDQWSVVDVRGDQPLETVWVASQQVLNELILHDVLTANAALLRAVETGDVAQYESVCDAEWFVGDTKDPASVMTQQEGGPVATGEVCRAQLDFISGKHVAVSYDRVMQGEVIREKRIWSHQGQAGWRNVHFARTPIVS